MEQLDTIFYERFKLKQYEGAPVVGPVLNNL